MKAASKTAVTLLLLGMTFISQAQTAISNTDILPVVGSWQGSLRYLDYTSKKQVEIPATVEIEQIKTGVFIFKNQFPKEPHVQWTDTIAISNQGVKWGKETVSTKTKLADGSVEITTQEKGQDDKKPALIKRTYQLGDNIYAVKKEVQFEGSSDWLLRHIYRYETRAKLLTPQEMKADLNTLKTTWEIIHPGLYRYNTKAEIESYFQEADVFTNRSLEQRRFFILISQFNIKLRCGHSFVSYNNNKRILKNNLYSTVFIPVLFSVIENKFIITHNLSEDTLIKQGEEITAINGIPVQTIIDTLLTVSKADGKNGRDKQLDNMGLEPREIYTDRYTLFDIFFPLFFKKDINEPDFILDILNEKAQKRKVVVSGVSKPAREEKYIARYGDIPRNEESWYVKPIDDKTIIFRIGDFMTYKWKFNFTAYLDSVFMMMNGKGYKNLIVDIRKNEGGADDARNAVLSYLTPRDLGCAMPYRRLYRYNQIPDSLQKYLSTWDDNFRKPKPDSLFRKTADGFYESRQPAKCIEIFSNRNHFNGNIYLITDVTNSSATFTMADVFKQNKLGTIVGEKTGGTLQGINGGEIFFFYLPHSKIEMDIPLIWQRPVMERPDDGVIPDFEVKTTVKDVQTQTDPQVTYIVKKLLQ